MPEPAHAFLDSDRDGAVDESDAFPCDQLAHGAAFDPAQGDHGTLMFEDQWPSQGDHDFNDVVLGYNYIYRLNGEARIRSLRLTLNVLAAGGIFDNGIGFHLPISKSLVSSVKMTIGSGAPQTLTPVAADSQLNVVLINDVRTLFSGGVGQVNSDASKNALSAPAIEIEVVFTNINVTLDLTKSPYDLYIFRTDDPTLEVHRPEYRGTSRFNAARFGTQDDGTTATRAFIDRGGVPFSLTIPTLAEYPKEAVRIENLFPRIVQFGASGGTQAQDFYVNGIQPQFAFTTGNGIQKPAPVFLGPDHYPAQTGCIQSWGVAVDFGTRRNMFGYGSARDAAGNVLLTGYVRGTFPGLTSAGGRDVFVAKYNGTTGARLWAHQFGGPGDETGQDVLVDAAGNIYVTGETQSGFSGSTSAGPSAGGYDAFIAKYDSAGQILWVHSIGGAGEESSWGIAANGAGRLAIAGGSTSLDLPGDSYPGNGPFSFVAEFTTSGALLHVDQYLADSTDQTNVSYNADVAYDLQTGAIYTVGSEKRYNVQGSAGTNQYVVKHLSDGTIAWAHHIGGFGFYNTTTQLRFANAFGVSVDQHDGSVYVTGNWQTGSSNAPWGSWHRAMGDKAPHATITKVSASGNELWRHDISPSAGRETFGEEVLADGVSDMVYVSGRTNGQFPGRSAVGGGYDYFLAAFNGNGTTAWIGQGGSTANDEGRIAAVSFPNDTAADVFLIGQSTGWWGGLDSGPWDLHHFRHNGITGNGSQIFRVTASTYGWAASGYGPCSTTCGLGTKTRNVFCVNSQNTPVADSFCVEAKPSANALCNVETSCPYRWNAPAFPACPATCGSGVVSRVVACKDSGNNTVADSFCPGTKPATASSCSNFSGCAKSWQMGTYSACSASCGGGVQSRSVVCLRTDGAPVADSQCAGTKPLVQRACNTQACGANASSCATLLRAGNTANGVYNIDPDGDGPTAARDVYCDMTSNGGGWTNIDLAGKRIYLGANFIDCKTNLIATANTLYCDDPNWNGNQDASLFLFNCSGKDRSAAYLLDEVAPMLGHQSSDTVGGWVSYLASYDGSNAKTPSGVEYCMSNGAIFPNTAPECARYSGAGNGACVPSFFELRR